MKVIIKLEAVCPAPILVPLCYERAFGACHPFSFNLANNSTNVSAAFSLINLLLNMKKSCQLILDTFLRVSIMP